ncbi:unannotated protein [freshwater metagenome]|uniref:Unannotated protein n=1 Tax=freshwater metagenome TaxID=449393 RepID=A0A6J7GQP6_9ZZZZ|nr:ABC transporter permease [Actinomycetota bacterium]
MALIVTLLAASLALCMPVLLAAVGELVNERAGVLNIGLEGVMLFGAFGAAFTFQLWGNFALSFVFGLIGGLFAWAILGALYLWRQTEQIVTGLLFNLFAFGFTATVFSRYTKEVGEVRTLPKLSFGPLTDIPVVGPILFNQNIVVYAAVVIVVGVSLLLNRTWFGLRIKAAGEMPLVAYENGVPVMRLRWVALGISCVLASLGGAALVLSESGIFLPGITSGAGFIALAMVVLGRFSAYGILIASFFFGIAASLQFYSDQLPFTSGGARYFWVAFPYVATLVALAVWRKARYPAAIGKEFIV